MNFLQPLGAIGFLAPALILALYFLRRKHTDLPVPSTLLWRQTAEDASAAHPFQRLRKNALMLLQLLIAALLAFSLMRPALPGRVAGETVMIFDCSASMQAKENGVSRLETAVEKAREHINAMRSDAPLTILSVGGETRQALSRSLDRSLAREALSSLRAENTGADLSPALSLARAMDAELGGVTILIFSDSFFPQPGVTVIGCGQGAENRALLSFTAVGDTAVARIANYGKDAELTVECSADGALCDAKRVFAGEGENVSVFFRAPENAQILLARLVDEDAIGTDNAAYFVRRDAGETKVALAGSNTFLEHALQLRQDVRLIRTTQEEWDGLEGVKLYVRDGDTVVFSRSAGFPPVTAGEVQAAEDPLSLASSAGAEALTRYLTLSGVALRQYRPLSGGEAFLRCGQDAVGVWGEDWAALGFDLHDSNLPLKYDFPVMIQNILSYLAPQDEGVKDGKCGQSLTLSAGGQVTTPLGRTLFVEDMGVFADTGEAGLYRLRAEGKEYPFAMVMEPGESDVRAAAETVYEGEAGPRTGQQEITGWLLLAALLLILLEGGLSRRVGAY